MLQMWTSDPPTRQNMHISLRRSELELRGPRKGIEIGPRSFRGVRSVQLLALIPNLTTGGAVLQVPRGF
eukprot:4070811-Alexandrium_andersonii.AAC.1